MKTILLQKKLLREKMKSVTSIDCEDLQMHFIRISNMKNIYFSHVQIIEIVVSFIIL